MNINKRVQDQVEEGKTSTLNTQPPHDKNASNMDKLLTDCYTSSEGEIEDKHEESLFEVAVLDAQRILRIYRELMDSIRKGPSSSKKCFAVSIDWMRKFQNFGKALS